MREINRILSDYDLLGTYFQTSYGGIYEEDIIAKHVFLPYCLGLKIQNRNNFLTACNRTRN